MYLDIQNIHILSNFHLLDTGFCRTRQEKLFKMGSILSSKGLYSS